MQPKPVNVIPAGFSMQVRIGDKDEPLEIRTQDAFDWSSLRFVLNFPRRQGGEEAEVNPVLRMQEFSAALDWMLRQLAGGPYVFAPLSEEPTGACPTEGKAEPSGRVVLMSLAGSYAWAVQQMEQGQKVRRAGWMHPSMLHVVDGQLVRRAVDELTLDDYRATDWEIAPTPVTEAATARPAAAVPEIPFETGLPTPAEEPKRKSRGKKGPAPKEAAPAPGVFCKSCGEPIAPDGIGGAGVICPNKHAAEIDYVITDPEVAARVRAQYAAVKAPLPAPAVTTGEDYTPEPGEYRFSPRTVPGGADLDLDPCNHEPNDGATAIPFGMPTPEEALAEQARTAPFRLPSGRQVDLMSIHRLLTDPPMKTDGQFNGGLLSTRRDTPDKSHPDTIFTRLFYLSPVAYEQEGQGPGWAAALPDPEDRILDLHTLDTQGVEDFVALLLALKERGLVPECVRAQLASEERLRARVKDKFTELSRLVRR